MANSQDIAFSVFPNASNTISDASATSESPQITVNLQETFALALTCGLNIAPLAGIPVLLTPQTGFKNAIRTWSLHHQPTLTEETRAVFRPETVEDITRIVLWAQKEGFKIMSRSGGAGGASGRGGICLDLGAFDQCIFIFIHSLVIDIMVVIGLYSMRQQERVE